MAKQASDRFAAKSMVGFHCYHHQDVQQNDKRTAYSVSNDSEDKYSAKLRRKSLSAISKEKYGTEPQLTDVLLIEV